MPVFDISLSRELQKMRETWPCLALARTTGHTRMVLLSVLAHTFDEALYVQRAAVEPDFDGSILAPHLTSVAKVDKTGAIVADVVQTSGIIKKDQVLFRSEEHLRDDFRQLADRLKLSDPDRIELFKCVQRWVVADRRLDPTFDPMDPDAKRMRLN